SFKAGLEAPEPANAAAIELLAKPRNQRIAELIDRLEDVAAGKFAVPGDLMFLWEPVCRRLAVEADAAVDSLIDVIENETRMTRSVDLTRPWYPVGKPIPVKEVAAKVLESIWQMEGLVEAATPTELRARWENMRRLSPIERRFQTLALDSVHPIEWVN